MPLTIVHISGPSGSGKTTLARVLASHVGRCERHYVRFDVATAEGTPELRIANRMEEMSSATRRCVNPKFSFEEVSEVLKSLARPGKHAMVFVETDTHPCFRHAYPYDTKVFMMLPPRSLSVVFRSRGEASKAIQRAMDDTSEFAAELFGLDRESLGSSILPGLDPKEPKGASRATQSVEDFLNSDVGTEIASRMQLQPDYQAIIDSEVILLNEAVEHNSQMATSCAQRIEVLLENLRRRLRRQNWFAACDPLDQKDPLTQRALRKILSPI